MLFYLSAPLVSWWFKRIRSLQAAEVFLYTLSVRGWDLLLGEGLLCGFAVAGVYICIRNPCRAGLIGRAHRLPRAKDHPAVADLRWDLFDLLHFFDRPARTGVPVVPTDAATYTSATAAKPYRT